MPIGKLLTPLTTAKCFWTWLSSRINLRHKSHQMLKLPTVTIITFCITTKTCSRSAIKFWPTLIWKRAREHTSSIAMEIKSSTLSMVILTQSATTILRCLKLSENPNGTVFSWTTTTFSWVISPLSNTLIWLTQKLDQSLQKAWTQSIWAQTLPQEKKLLFLLLQENLSLKAKLESGE